jgi:transcriptional regulator with XRE-family HTH domain
MKLTTIRLAHLSGVSDATITQIETGHVKNPGFRTIQKLARALGITMADFGGKK